ncbi:hypothetical protein CPB84DRAFT_1781710 [Gymnopilus junonius]|uniref:Uncharacterized protein n=1 Tax=Gymnopilus junonius TaxID=109634 RepID=A0A9P5NNQ5_GYMJU|nr:hypothetical protein CPB84DRAFT_1781710 [Gymnopilus junonius]
MTESKPDPLGSSAPGSSSLEYLHIEEIGRSSDLSLSHCGIDSMHNLSKHFGFLTNLRLCTANLTVINTMYSLRLGGSAHLYFPFNFAPPPLHFLHLQSLTIEAAFTVSTFPDGILINHFSSPLDWIIIIPSPSLELFRHIDADWRRLACCLKLEMFAKLVRMNVQVVDLSDEGLDVLQRCKCFQELSTTIGFVLSTP